MSKYRWEGKRVQVVDSPQTWVVECVNGRNLSLKSENSSETIIVSPTKVRLIDKPERLRDFILQYLEDHQCATATQIAKTANLRPMSVSSCLFKMFKEGLLSRTDGFGCRGGWGYSSHCHKLNSKSRFEMLIDEDL